MRRNKKKLGHWLRKRTILVIFALTTSDGIRSEFSKAKCYLFLDVVINVCRTRFILSQKSLTSRSWCWSDTCSEYIAQVSLPRTSAKCWLLLRTRLLRGDTDKIFDDMNSRRTLYPTKPWNRWREMKLESCRPNVAGEADATGDEISSELDKKQDAR